MLRELEYVIKDGKVYIKNTLFLVFKERSLVKYAIIAIGLMLLIALPILYAYGYLRELFNIILLISSITLTVLFSARFYGLKINVIRMGRSVGEIRPAVSKDGIKYLVRLEGRPLITYIIPKEGGLKNSTIEYGDRHYRVSIHYLRDHYEIRVFDKESNQDVVFISELPKKSSWGVRVSGIDVLSALTIAYVVIKSLVIKPLRTTQTSFIE